MEGDLPLIDSRRYECLDAPRQHTVVRTARSREHAMPGVSRLVLRTSRPQPGALRSCHGAVSSPTAEWPESETARSNGAQASGIEIVPDKRVDEHVEAEPSHVTKPTSSGHSGFGFQAG